MLDEKNRSDLIKQIIDACDPVQREKLLDKLLGRKVKVRGDTWTVSGIYDWRAATVDLVNYANVHWDNVWIGEFQLV